MPKDKNLIFCDILYSAPLPVFVDPVMIMKDRHEILIYYGVTSFLREGWRITGFRK